MIKESEPVSAIACYEAMIDAVTAQRERLHGGPWPRDRWSGANARRFRLDPRREPSPNLAAVAAYVERDDVVLDVGGGAGRVGLPLAMRCRELINLDPSAAMQAEFAECAAKADIGNVHQVRADWQSLGDLRGDVVLVANLTYFVREIDAFIRTLERAARRRVLITLWSVAPSVENAPLFALVYGEPQQPVPSYRELLPAIWELGILPDVRVLPERGHNAARPRTREEAVQRALVALRDEENATARARIEARFDALFTHDGGGYFPRWLPEVRELLITWETRSHG
ncbi:MAG TPA: class I SAM-dependent methyltransferase [Dehalococcoidia bacterium]|nr:class I SAM-dependent methyltransferase [Dehalococcoidia bacterium]